LKKIRESGYGYWRTKGATNLGVGDPATGWIGTSNSQQFKASFESEFTAISGASDITQAANAEADGAPIRWRRRRDALYPDFQSALGQIDPADPARRRKGAIDQGARMIAKCAERRGLSKFRRGEAGKGHATDLGKPREPKKLEGPPVSNRS
jgi:hypothetical protein